MNLSLGYLLVEHIVKVIVAIMAEALEDLERSELENAAEVPNMDNNMTTCTCRGICMRERGRNFCPCKSLGSFCSSSCHGDNFGRCMNSRRAQESDSDQTDSESSMEESEEEDVGRRGRGRARGRGRGRARGRGQQRGGRGRGRRGGRGRGQLVEEEQDAENVAWRIARWECTTSTRSGTS
ncbi:Hypothetical predicted protein [Paramuricea clavata]|uniref:Uncharacterized protein n=1 Tax=Paramuricea clavata TaxID=317549 RepID=A0A6S7HNL7_PARCT|nr:Hypothetical predicted protein [Paramuricea clavata]